MGPPQSPLCPAIFRLTWLGDAVLGAAVSDLLYRSLPSNATTGQLHDARAARVRREACAVAAKRLGLAPLLVVGKGYEGQEPTPAMLAGAAADQLHFSAQAVGSILSCWHESSWQRIARINCKWLVMHGHAAGLLSRSTNTIPSACTLPPSPQECFEAVWGAVYEDSGYSLHQVRQTYNQLFPV